MTVPAQRAAADTPTRMLVLWCPDWPVVAAAADTSSTSRSTSACSPPK
ncbi:hypothetical protein [Amycolatopsis balhimycina]